MFVDPKNFIAATELIDALCTLSVWKTAAGIYTVTIARSSDVSSGAGTTADAAFEMALASKNW